MKQLSVTAGASMLACAISLAVLFSSCIYAPRASRVVLYEHNQTRCNVSQDIDPRIADSIKGLIGADVSGNTFKGIERAATPIPTPSPTPSATPSFRGIIVPDFNCPWLGITNWPWTNSVILTTGGTK